MIGILGEVVPESAMNDLEAQLPDEYDEPFELEEAQATAGPNPEE